MRRLWSAACTFALDVRIEAITQAACKARPEHLCEACDTHAARLLQATAELFDKDGFYVTGDIMRQETPTRVVWIDRKKNVLKLSQGEFVSLGRLEAVYKGGSNLIHQVCWPTQSCLVHKTLKRRTANLVQVMLVIMCLFPAERRCV